LNTRLYIKIKAYAYRHNYISAAFLSVIMALFSAVMGAGLKFASIYNMPNCFILFTRFIFCFVILIPIILQSRGRVLITDRLSLILLRCLLGFLSMATYLLAIVYVPLVNAVLLKNTTPLFVPLLLLVFLRKRLNKLSMICLIVGFIGITLIIKPTASSINPYLIFGLISGLFGAGVLVLTRILTKSVMPATILLYYYMTATVITATWCIVYFLRYDLNVNFSFYAYLTLLAVGISSIILQFSFTFALKLAPTSIVTPLFFLSVVFSFILGLYLFNQQIDTATSIGIVLASAGAIFSTIVAGRNKSKA
jgi:drug/metabolite transporter (DMT)-like permease